MRALLVYPTHANCAEVRVEAVYKGLDALVYPGRFTEGKAATEAGEQASEQPAEEPNCWNCEADDAEAMGFPVVKTICPTCPQRQRCKLQGYLRQLIAVQKADVAICTHKRVEYSGFEDLCAGRPYVSVHENPIDLLRPRCGSSVTDLTLIQSLFHRLLNDPRRLDWFGNAVRVDDDGNEYHSEEVARRKERLLEFCRRIADVVDDLLIQIDAAETITEWPIPGAMPRPSGIERLLFCTTRQLNLQFAGQPWRFVLAASAGELQSAAVVVKQMGNKKGRETAVLIKSVIGFRANPPASANVTWFNDATISVDTLSSVLNRPAQDKTPVGHLERQKKAVQIPLDMTRKRSPRIFANTIRGILADRPQFQRVGIITHRPCLPAIQLLGAAFTPKIVRRTYFGSGEERSSNAWHQECDLIIVAGTPRVPQDALAEYLIQIGRIGAAAREVVWSDVRWTGKTESGEGIQVTGKGYHDEDWRQAHRDLVRATLVQAVGRGRGILESGCEVVVLSTEECGLPISDLSVKGMNEAEVAVLSALRQLCAQNSYKYIKENCAHRTAEIASVCGLKVRQTQLALKALELRGLVRRVGERGGWLPVQQPLTEGAPCPT